MSPLLALFMKKHLGPGIHGPLPHGVSRPWALGGDQTEKEGKLMEKKTHIRMEIVET